MMKALRFILILVLLQIYFSSVCLAAPKPKKAKGTTYNKTLQFSARSSQTTLSEVKKGMIYNENVQLSIRSGQIGLQWDANTDLTGLAGYRLYYGFSPRTGIFPAICGMCNYIYLTEVGNVTMYYLPNLEAGRLYYFSATAYNAADFETGFSNEITGYASGISMVATGQRQSSLTESLAGLSAIGLLGDVTPGENSVALESSSTLSASSILSGGNQLSLSGISEVSEGSLSTGYNSIAFSSVSEHSATSTGDVPLESDVTIEGAAEQSSTFDFGSELALELQGASEVTESSILAGVGESTLEANPSVTGVSLCDGGNQLIVACASDFALAYSTLSAVIASYFVPGFGMVSDQQSGREYLIPGYGMFNEGVAGEESGTDYNVGTTLIASTSQDETSLEDGYSSLSLTVLSTGEQSGDNDIFFTFTASAGQATFSLLESSSWNPIISYFLPGYGMAADAKNNRDYLIPGYGMFNESSGISLTLSASATGAYATGALDLVALLSAQSEMSDAAIQDSDYSVAFNILVTSEETVQETLPLELSASADQSGFPEPELNTSVALNAVTSEESSELLDGSYRAARFLAQAEMSQEPDYMNLDDFLTFQDMARLSNVADTAAPGTFVSIKTFTARKVIYDWLSINVRYAYSAKPIVYGYRARAGI